MDRLRCDSVSSDFVKLLIVKALVETGKKFEINMDKSLVNFIVKERQKEPASMRSLLAVCF